MWGINLLFFPEGLLFVSIALLFRRKYRKTLSGFWRKWEEKDSFLRSRKTDLERETAEQAFLERRLSDLVELYEVSRKLSVSLEIRELIAILSETLNERFSFDKGYLLLFQEETPTGELQSIEKIYALKHPAVETEEEQTAPQKLLLYLEEVLGREGEREEYFKGKRAPFTAFPLRVGDRLIAALVCEGVTEGDSEQIALLSRPCALVIQKVKLYARLQRLAITDGLTHLYSRRYFLERFLEELERSKRLGLSLSFLMADLDHFKQKNDQYGHLVGDMILREVAALLKSSVREIDLVGRYGGEEFSILLPDTQRQEAFQVAERIRKHVAEREFSAYGEVIPVTVSIGLGSFPEDGETAVDLMEVADSALYHAKQSGRNRIAAHRQEDLFQEG